MFMILCLSVLFLVPVHVNVKGLMRRLRVTDAPVHSVLIRSSQEHETI